MRIISKMHDYYDGVMKTGMDREVVYLRENKEIELKHKFDLGFSSNHKSSNHEVNTLILGYCGQIFKVYEVRSSSSADAKWRYIFYNYEDFKKFSLSNKLGSQFDFGERRWWPSGYQKFRDLDTKMFIELFHAYQTPLFIFTNVYRYSSKDTHTIELGPCLQDLQFQKIKDPYTAYQDIFQFVAGTLNKPENKMVKLSDKDKIAKHGFDKWSFRQKGPK